MSNYPSVSDIEVGILLRVSWGGGVSGAMALFNMG